MMIRMMMTMLSRLSVFLLFFYDSEEGGDATANASAASAVAVTLASLLLSMVVLESETRFIGNKQASS